MYLCLSIPVSANTAHPAWESVETGHREELGIILLHKVHWEWFGGSEEGAGGEGVSARFWEELFNKFAQACLTNERELQIRAAEADMSAYQQLWLHSHCWAPEQPTERSAHGLLENCNKFCPELMRTCAERWITCSWNWKHSYVIGTFCCLGDAWKSLQIPSCPANNAGNSWFRFPFSLALSEPGVGQHIPAMTEHDPLFWSMEKERTHLTKQLGAPREKKKKSWKRIHVHHGLQRLGIATAAQKRVKSRGGLHRAFAGVGRSPSPGPLLVPCLYRRVDSIKESNRDECNHGEPFIGKLFGTHQKLNLH